VVEKPPFLAFREFSKASCSSTSAWADWLAATAAADSLVLLSASAAAAAEADTVHPYFMVQIITDY